MQEIGKDQDVVVVEEPPNGVPASKVIDLTKGQPATCVPVTRSS